MFLLFLPSDTEPCKSQEQEQPDEEIRKHAKDLIDKLYENKDANNFDELHEEFQKSLDLNWPNNEKAATGSILQMQQTYPEYEWKDITKDFFHSCSELALGELFHDCSFGLFDAMSAIEMMDPKMDVGMGFTSSKNAIPHTFETAVEAGILKLVDLESSELIGLFDALYSCVVSWLEGLSLDQILFTCLYLHNPMAIEDKSLKVFCIAIRKLVTLINQCISQCNVNEEEDFQLFVSSNYNFFPYMQNTKIIQNLKEAEDDLVKKAKAQSSPMAEGTLAVMHRLRFLRFLFHSLHLFQTKRKDPIGEHEIAEIQKILSSALEVIPLIQKTISKGTQPEENCK